MESQRMLENETASNDAKSAMDPQKKAAATTNIGAFNRLPDEIIQQILQLTSPNSFASCILLNTKWRKVSQQASFYADNLAKCPSYQSAHPGRIDDEESLSKLRRLFAREVKRNLYEAYLRPQETIINLVSTSISSSSAPGGEAFHFSISPRGHYVLAYSSSRIHVLDVTGPEVEVKRELKILRRPASTTITDDGYILAVLSTDLQVDLYDMRSSPPKHTRAVALDHTPRTIALSPTGSVLACAYDSGVEVSSLDRSSAGTDRRAVKCYAVDSLSFSQDGTQLLGSTLQDRNPSTVVLTAPYYDPGGNLPEDVASALWTTSILFPNGSRDCSHSVLLPNPSDGESSWTFTYDRIFETFRCVRIDDLRNGTTYFTGPIADSASVSKLLPSTLPAASESGDLVAAGFQGAVWLYGIPEDLDGLPNLRDASNGSDSGSSTPSHQLGRQNSANSTRSNRKLRDSSGGRIPQWQLLLDKFRNTFVEGRKIAVLGQVSALSWVDDCSTLCHQERLVAVAPGVSGQLFGSDDDGMAPVDGGRISILDFSYSPVNGEKRCVTLEVGAREPEILEEEHRDLDTEVAIVRRRTVAQRRGNRSHVSRSATSVARSPRSEVPPPLPGLDNSGSPFVPIPLPIRRASQQTVTSEYSESASVDEDLDAFDAPYSHTSPRSGGVLRRAATAAAVNRRLNPRAVAQDHIEYRRADGREEHPHESDADQWEPPPPPYTRQALPLLPEHIQRSIQAEAAAAVSGRSRTQRSPNLQFSDLGPNTLHRSHTIASTSTSDSRRERARFQRTFSDSTIMSSDRISLEEEPTRSMTSPISGDYNDLYDVSPPGTPPLQPQADVLAARTVQVASIPRRPVGATPGSSPSSRRVASQNSIPPQETSLSAESVDVPQIILDTSISESANMDQSDGLDQLSSVSGPLNVPTYPDDLYANELTPPLSTSRTVPILQQPGNEPIPESQPTVMISRAETAPVPASTSQFTDDVPLPIWRSGTLPAVPPKDIPIAAVPDPRSMMPSADQIARLNSRRGRPAGITDPRRASGSSIPQRNPSGGHSRNASTGSFQGPPLPPRMTPEQAFQNRSSAPRAAAGAHGSQPRQGQGQNLAPQPHHPYAQSQSPSRRLHSNSNSHHRTPSGSPGLRPSIQRLETIHSQISIPAEPSPFLVSKSMMVSRQPSRAERSAAKNIKDAKKKGWRSSMKSGRREKEREGGSSVGWTDGTGEGSVNGGEGGKEKKCVVM